MTEANLAWLVAELRRALHDPPRAAEVHPDRATRASSSPDVITLEGLGS